LAAQGITVTLPKPMNLELKGGRAFRQAGLPLRGIELREQRHDVGEAKLRAFKRGIFRGRAGVAPLTMKLAPGTHSASSGGSRSRIAELRREGA
jgi:hypothetical protein